MNFLNGSFLPSLVFLYSFVFFLSLGLFNGYFFLESIARPSQYSTKIEDFFFYCRLENRDSIKDNFCYFLLLCVTIDVLRVLAMLSKFLVSFISDIFLKSIPFFEDLRKVEWHLRTPSSLTLLCQSGHFGRTKLHCVRI